MSLFKDIVFGRKNGFRARLVRSVLGGGLEPEPPAAHHAAAEKALNLGVEAPKDVTPPDGYEVVLHKDALKPGEVVEVIISGKALAVANVDGTFHACSNRCPHADGPLGEGSLQGHVLSCPYHGWRFDVTDGSCLTSPDDKIPVYSVQVIDDAVCVKI